MSEEEYVDYDGFVSDESDFYGDEHIRAEFETLARRRLKPYKPDFPPISTEWQAGQTVEQLRSIDFFEARHGDGSWKQSETILDFLHRLPVGDPATTTSDGWIWVGASKIPVAHFQHMQATDTMAFIDQGNSLLRAFDELVVKAQNDEAHKPRNVVSRTIAPYREDLARDILATAVKTNTTSGKWMLFPGEGDLIRCWRQVAMATADSKLGPMAKVATNQPGRRNTLICVYTYDFSDIQDVRRVLNELVELGLVASSSRPIYYKCDAYTHLGIESSNKWDLRASLFSSKEVLEDEIKACKDGPLANLIKKRDKNC